ncbi:MAG: 4'-phosphopantetheinyl transferase superfamily protein [Bacteroidales bacterium]|nr:4'-phosphopantetheinyl transferase superfamily protein [Bacteroidales bacterium]
MKEDDKLYGHQLYKVYINDHVDLLDITVSLDKVSAQRRDQALRYQHKVGRRLCLAAYLLLMEGLEKEYGIIEPPLFSYTPEGKPFLSEYPEIHFSFSHSGNVALCALSDQPVGADVETPRKITPSLISYTMNEIEQAIINASIDPTIQFLHFWTRKEALLKLTGEGIRNNLRMVLSEAEKYQMETVQTEKYIYSIVQYNTGV